MAFELVVETYDLKLGTGPGDGAAVMVLSGYRTIARAEVDRDRFLQLLSEGALSIPAGSTFYVEPTAGAQRLALVTTPDAPTSNTIRQDLQNAFNARQITVPLYVKAVDPTTTPNTIEYKRVLRVTADKILETAL